MADLAKMPHLLIAGTTGSGKSVALNTMILSLLYRLSPEHCRKIMIDPKMLELSVYEGIPHLLSPVVTDPKKAVVALKWTVREMEERYRKMSKLGVRGVEAFNERVRKAKDKNEVLKHERAAYIPSITRAQPRLQYHYAGAVLLGEETDFIRFLNAMAAGEIYYDPGIKLEAASTKHPKLKRRSQFRVAVRNLPRLYGKTERAAL